MSAFLSEEWLAELDAAARAADLATDEPVVFEQVVQAADGRELRYRVRFGPDGATVAAASGCEAHADVELATDRATAWALHQGHVRAQDAFARGDLKVRGRAELLGRRAGLFAALERALAPVRARTTPGDAR